MNQHENAWLRKIIFLSLMILVVVSSIASFNPIFAQIAPANFDAVDAYISTRMKELGIPGTALVIVRGDQIVHLKAFGVAAASGRPVTPQTPFFADEQAALNAVASGALYCPAVNLERPSCLFTADPFTNCFRGGFTGYSSVSTRRRMGSGY